MAAKEFKTAVKSFTFLSVFLTNAMPIRLIVRLVRLRLPAAANYLDLPAKLAGSEAKCFAEHESELLYTSLLISSFHEYFNDHGIGHCLLN